MKKILIVVGTRPNFIKITQFPRVINAFPGKFQLKILHTGQHYDDAMSGVFFEQFKLKPDFFLNIGPGSPNTQIARIMLGLEDVFANEYLPDLVIVPGDVNSTLAAALASHKMGIPIAHLESGLRSYDRSMPEEINRILTDEVSDYFYITEQSGIDNLAAEGRDSNRFLFVGNTMIDTLVGFQEEIKQSPVLTELGLENQQFALMTMHRPATVDQKEGLSTLMQIIRNVCANRKLVFPIHPRTMQKLKDFGLHDDFVAIKNLVLTGPLDYFAFQRLTSTAKFILTDSGGIQEESTFYQVPCLTLRPNTERPITVDLGTNELVPLEAAVIAEKIAQIENGRYKKGEIPQLWDGKATERIVAHIEEVLCST